jgi:hypothetical protein
MGGLEAKPHFLPPELAFIAFAAAPADLHRSRGIAFYAR